MEAIEVIRNKSFSKDNQPANFCYHGIDGNLLRYESIMKYGILSSQYRSKIPCFSQNYDRGFNGTNAVSVALPHSDESGALLCYIYGSIIAFYIKIHEDGQVIEKTKAKKSKLAKSVSNYVDSILNVLRDAAGIKYEKRCEYTSTFLDEGFVMDYIPIGNIKGIYVSSKYRDTPLSEIPLLNNIDVASVREITYSVFSEIGDKVPNGIEDLLDILEGYKYIPTSFKGNSTTIIDSISKILSNRIELYYKEKLGMDRVTLMDVINKYNINNLPIYSKEDIEEQCRGYSLKKLR